MLSCPTPGAIAYSYAHFGSGSGGIFLDNVGCRGTESTLLSCTHSGVGVHNCRHNADAGVRCLGKGFHRKPIMKESLVLILI